MHFLVCRNPENPVSEAGFRVMGLLLHFTKVQLQDIMRACAGTIVNNVDKHASTSPHFPNLRKHFPNFASCDFLCTRAKGNPINISCQWSKLWHRFCVATPSLYMLHMQAQGMHHQSKAQCH